MAYFIGSDYGMYGYGESCGAAFRHILSIMPNGSSLYLPAGLYADFLDVEIVNRHDLTFYGDGHATILQRTNTVSGSGDMFRFRGCTGIQFRDMAFDQNGLDRFGGIVAYDAARWRVNGCRFFDSNPPPVGTKDRRSLYFGLPESTSGNRDIWIDGNLIEGLQLDMHAGQRVHISHNTLRGGVLTAGIAIVSGRDGLTIEDYLITGNLIDSPVGSGIGVSLDPASTNNGMMQRITITDNVIRIGPQTTRGIYLGSTNNGTASSGNTMRDISVLNNTITVTDGNTRTYDALIFGNNSITANVSFENWQIIGNVLRGNNTGRGIDVRRGVNALTTPNVIVGAL